MMTAAVLAGFGLLAILRVPVPFAMLIPAILTLVFFDSVPLMVAPQYMIAGLTKFELLAIPFFILAAELMNSAGLTRRIFAFAQVCVGWMRGGLAQVNIVASIVFAGISGTAVADAAGLGRIELRTMKEAGYDMGQSVGITLASCVVGPLIPPSVVLIVYAITAEVSVGRMLLAGALPGLLVAGLLMSYVYLLARRSPEKFPTQPRPTRAEARHAVLAGFRAVLAPFIILAGIVWGIVTPTEAGVAACVYSLLVSGLVYRTLSFAGVWQSFVRALHASGSVMFIISAATLVGWIVVRDQSAAALAEWFGNLTDQVWLQLVIVNVFLLIVGCLIEGVPALLILTPVLLPLMIQLGIDPEHFGVVFILNIVIGILTPPMGVGLFIMSGMTGLTALQVIRASTHYLIPLLLALGLITAFPAISLWLPNLLMGGP